MSGATTGAVATVCGTRIEAAADDDRTRTILLSDLHLGRDGGAPLAAFEDVLEDARREPERTRVLILGDLFEFYATDAQLAEPDWSAIPAAMPTGTHIAHVWRQAPMCFE